MRTLCRVGRTIVAGQPQSGEIASLVSSFFYFLFFFEFLNFLFLFIFYFFIFYLFIYLSARGFLLLDGRFSSLNQIPMGVYLLKKKQLKKQRNVPAKVHSAEKRP